MPTADSVWGNPDQDVQERADRAENIKAAIAAAEGERARRISASEPSSPSRTENIKFAIAAAEGERTRRMSEDSMAEVQAEIIKQKNIESAKKAADDEQAARAASANAPTPSRVENIKAAVVATEDERARRMSEDKMAGVQADIIKRKNIETAKKAADAEQAARIAEMKNATVASKVARNARIKAAKKASDSEQAQRIVDALPSTEVDGRSAQGTNPARDEVSSNDQGILLFSLLTTRPCTTMPDFVFALLITLVCWTTAIKTFKSWFSLGFSKVMEGSGKVTHTNPLFNSKYSKRTNPQKE